MSVAPELDAPRPAREEGFSDAVTLSFGDARAGLYGTARLGLSGGRVASGLVVLFHRGEVAAVAAEGGVAVEDATAWERVAAAGLDVATVQPLRAWRVAFAGEDASLDLEVEAAGAACALAEHDPVARAGGMLGFEQPVRVRGAAHVGGRPLALDGLGQRGRSWGAPDWTRLSRTRTLGAWFPGRAIALSAVAREGEEHGGEAIGATLFTPAEDGSPGCVTIGDPRLSTTFDADGRQRRAALELWVTDEGPVHRAWGEVVCGTTLDLGRLRLDTAFLTWHMDGERGPGRYDILTRAAPPPDPGQFSEPRRSQR